MANELQGPAMTLIETTVRGPLVRLLYADAPTKEQATEWLELQMKVGGDDNRRLGVIQKDALQRVRTLLNAESARFQSLADSLHR
jgi:hypothetical protein